MDDAQPDEHPAIDTTDYALLQCIRDAKDPLWKNAVHSRLLERADELPGVDEVSVQTVGRRIDTLHENALITSEIINPDDLRRALIIGYTLTADGAAALRQKQEDLLKEYLSGDREPEQNEKQFIISLLDAINDLDAATVDYLREDCTPDEIRAFTELYFMKRFVAAHFSPDRVNELLELTGQERSDILFPGT